MGSETGCACCRAGHSNWGSNETSKKYPQTVIQFPGYGGYRAGAFAQFKESFPKSFRILNAIDRIAIEYGYSTVSSMLLAKSAPPLESLIEKPGEVHLASYASSLAMYEAARSKRLRRHLLLGLSTGEYTALAAAKCISPSDGARAICERETALVKGKHLGGLTAFRASGERMHLLSQASGLPNIAPALYNSPSQTVITGTIPELEVLERMAREVGIQATRLPDIYKHHCASLESASREIAEKLKMLPVSAPEIEVYSPVLGRQVRTAEDVRRVLRDEVRNPVNYLSAVRQLNLQGYFRFIELSPVNVLDQLTRQSGLKGTQSFGAQANSKSAVDIINSLPLGLA